MEINELTPGVIAFIRPEEGVNAGLIRTPQGPVVVDTTLFPADMQELLDVVQVQASAVQLVINTHFHSDHTWGNQLFSCPILAHRRCPELMAAAMEKAWSAEAFAGYIAEVERTDPERARQMRSKTADLRIVLPNELFDDRCETVVGGVKLQVIHMDAHTPDSSMVWLPQARVLFAGDLLFIGGYPYMFDSDVPAWIAALKRLADLPAVAIVPGHGPLCGQAEIADLLHYLEESWARTIEHIARCHSEDEAAADPAYPRYADKNAERLHEANIRVMYRQAARTGWAAA